MKLKSEPFISNSKAVRTEIKTTFMKLKTSLIIVLSLIALAIQAQTYTEYEVSFDNVVHHEMDVAIKFANLEDKVLEVRMSRTSPGRYALHEFAKNVYSVKATDSKGNELKITRPNPHQWDVSGHDGTVNFKYTLYANRAGGTYSGVDETHAHLNIPATFAFARNLGHRPVKVKYNLPQGSNWKVATQMKAMDDGTYYAPNNYYFMDSPTEIADFHLRERKLDGKNIRLALHTPATDAEVDKYFEELMGVVEQQKAVFGELPDFDYGEYTFLSCYVPNASGDGMEHRNSTYVVSGKPADRPLASTSMGTISHEFFHCWNVERIRPKSLEPFNFEEANMSGELWFAEGFTSYYTNLIRARSGSITKKQYANGLGGAVNYVINAPGRKFHTPIEMSYQAPFVDAARSVDPVNRGNTFISYYTYGSVLGLALDMSLRSMDNGLNLDDYMKLVWQKYGKPEIPYAVRDLQATLAEYAGARFANQFFGDYIFNSQMPDYTSLFKKMGLNFNLSNPEAASLGDNIRIRDGRGQLTSNATIGGPLYNAGIEAEDQITTIAGTSLAGISNVNDILKNHKPGEKISIEFERWGVKKSVQVTLEASKARRTTWDQNADSKAAQRREAWLAKKG